jgi:hypothetical protein
LGIRAHSGEDELKTLPYAIRSIDPIGSTAGQTGEVANEFCGLAICNNFNALHKFISVSIHLLNKMNQLLNKLIQVVNMATTHATADLA